MLSMFPLYISILFFDISFFLRENGNKAMQFFCAIPVAIDFSIVFRNFYIVNNFFIYLYDDEINLPTYQLKESLPIMRDKLSLNRSIRSALLYLFDKL